MNRAKKEALQNKPKKAVPEWNIIFEDTPEKFQAIANEILPPFIELLRNLCALEEEVYARSRRLRESRPGGIYSTVAHPDSDTLWQEYRERYHALLDPCCTEKFLAARRGCCQSMGDPAEFSGLNRGGTVLFTMKSKSKAVVTTTQAKFGHLDYRFDLKPSDSGWKIDKASYRFLNDAKWHTDFYM